MSTSSPDYFPAYPYAFIEGLIHHSRQRMRKGDAQERAWIESEDFIAFWREWSTVKLDPYRLRRLLLGEWLTARKKYPKKV